MIDRSGSAGDAPWMSDDELVRLRARVAELERELARRPPPEPEWQKVVRAVLAVAVTSVAWVVFYLLAR